MGDTELEERSRLLSRIRALETELNARLKARNDSKKHATEIAVGEVLEDLERSLKDPNADWESDSEGEEDVSQEKAISKKAKQDILKFARSKVNSIKSAIIIVRNDCEMRTETVIAGATVEERPKEVYVEVHQGMTLRSLVELACEYFGVAFESNIRLVDERGIWHKMDQAVLEAIRPSRRRYPALYLQRRNGIDEVLRQCEFSNGNDEFFLAQQRKKQAPIAPVVHVPVNDQTTTTAASGSRLNNNGTTLALNSNVINHTQQQQVAHAIWRLDPILFSWRRVACDFLLCLALFIILCVFLALAPKYTEASGVTKLVAGSLVDVNFVNPITNTTRTSVKDMADWNDFWAWANGPLTHVVNQEYFLEKQSVLLGPVRFRQNRVKPKPCLRRTESTPCYPEYSPGSELTDAMWAGTKFIKNDPSVQRISALFGDYAAQGYIVDVVPFISSSSEFCTSLPLNNGEDQVCGPTSITPVYQTCWQCLLDALEGNGWLDDGSRLVTVQFIVYNANANMFIDSIFAFELGSHGFLHVTYEVRYISVRTLSPQQRSAFIAIVSLLISVIGIQFFQTTAYMRAVWTAAARMDTHSLTSEPYFLYRIWWSLPTKYTIWNPIIFALCVGGLAMVDADVSKPVLPQDGNWASVKFASILALGSLQTGEILLGVANMAVAYKLATYFQFTSLFLGFFQGIFENMFMLCLAMTLALCSFAWLLTVTSINFGNAITPSFAENFVFVVRLLLNQVSPEEFERVGADRWFSLSWVFYASQISLNLILVRIAAPICYHALKRENSAAEFVMEHMRRINFSIKQVFAT